MVRKKSRTTLIVSLKKSLMILRRHGLLREFTPPSDDIYTILCYCCGAFNCAGDDSSSGVISLYAGTSGFYFLVFGFCLAASWKITIKWLNIFITVNT